MSAIAPSTQDRMPPSESVVAGRGDDVGPRASAVRVSPQRSSGRAALALAGGGHDARGPHRLRHLRQEGCLKLRLPLARGGAREAIVSNTAGGLTGGDRLALEFRASERAWLRLSSAACEKIYRSDGGVARQRLVLAVDAARLDWLPQETILFEGAAFEREIEISLTNGASALVCEAFVLGREAMGESPTRLRFAERWCVRRDGRVMHREALCLTRAALGEARRAGGLGRRRAFATALLFRAAPEETLRALAEPIARDAADDPGVGVGVMPGRVVLRLAASGARELRARLLPALAALGGESVPSVWHV